MEPERKTAFIVVKNQFLFSEVQPFWFCIGLRALELAHHANGNHFIEDQFLRDLICFLIGT